MKKAIILFIVLLFSLFQCAFAQNVIYSADINKNADGDTILRLKSDYNAHTHAVEDKDGSIYFDIKNAKLADNYKTDYNGDISLVSQQIGSKVRIYLKGENLQMPAASFNSEKQANSFDFTIFTIFCSIAGILYLAYKFYCATIDTARSTTAIRSPMLAARDLNRQLYGFEKKRPEIVLNKSNPVKSDVLVDFQYAKDRKNTKIAI